jgi:hypothetical protein
MWAVAVKHFCRPLLISFCCLTGSLDFVPRVKADGATNTVAQQRAIDECHTQGEMVRALTGDIDPVIFK